MRLLFIAPFPYARHAAHGGATAAWAQMDVLRSHHDIMLVCFEATGAFALEDTDSASTLLRDAGVRYRGVSNELSRKRIWWARFRALVTQWPVDAELHRSATMRRTVTEALASFHPHAVIVQFPHMAHYVDVCGGVPAFLDVQDAASVSSKRAINAARSRRSKWQSYVNWRRWVRFEGRYYHRFRSVHTLTQEDLDGLRRYQPGLAGAALGMPFPVRPLTPTNVRPDTIRFVGNFHHEPNVAAVRFFATHVLPLIRLQMPTATFEVAGKDPPEDLLATASGEAKFVGFVPDLASFLSEATVVVIPLISGAGLKVKMLEALGAGAAVVSTSIGAEGVGGQHGVHYLLSDEPASFSGHVLRILRDPASAAGLRLRGHELVRDRFAPEAWRRRFESLIAGSIDGKL